MIYAQWTNEFELGRPFRPPTELMLGQVKKIDPGSILNPVERCPTLSLETQTDFENGIAACRELQERFEVYFPALPSSMAVTGRFCPAAGRATKAHGLPQPPNQPQLLLGKFCFCFCWEVWRGAAPSK